MDTQCISNEFYKSRKNEISTIEEKDKQNLEKLLLERKQKNEQLEMAISNIPEDFTEIIKE